MRTACVLLTPSSDGGLLFLKQLAMALRSFEVQSCIRGYHIYMTVWTPYIGETLPCSQENTNGHDPFAVKVSQLTGEDETIVGHLPRKISSTCSIFLRKGGKISATVCGSRRFSRDLVQGGLEIPCQLKLETTDDVLMSKAQKLLIRCQEKEASSESLSQPSKKIKLEDKENFDSSTMTKSKDLSPDVWLSLRDPGVVTLHVQDKEAITSSQKLHDLHILFGQCLLKRQFPEVQGLSCTLIQSRLRFDIQKEFVQICHIRNNHWIVISNMLSKPGEVHVFDSVYTDIDVNTEGMIRSMFEQLIEIKLHPGVPKQEGCADCGVICIAICTLLLHKKPLRYTQSLLRPCLISFFENLHLSLFP